MKKLFSIGVLTLVTLMSCQNSNDEIMPKQEAKVQLSKNMASKTTNSGPSDNAVINAVSELMAVNRLPGGGAQIMCHTDYLASSGSACVYNGGYMFSVTWGTEWVYQPSSGQFLDQTVWHSTSVHSCGC